MARLTLIFGLLLGVAVVLVLVLGVDAQERRRGEAGAAAGPPRANSPDEQRILSVIDEVQPYLSVPQDDGRLLRLLAEAIGAKNVVEIGTSSGYSGLWLCLALRTTGGHLTTFEIDEGRYKMAGENFKKAGVESLVTQVLGDAHEKVVTHDFGGPIDLLFIDADKPGYLDYLTKLLPKVRPGGLILAHNTTNPAPDPKFIEAITTNPALETLFLNVSRQGMGVTLKKR